MASLKKRIEGEIESALSELGGGPVKTAAVCEAILSRWGVDKESFGATTSGKLLWTREYPKAFATLRKKGIIYAPQWGQVALSAGDAYWSTSNTPSPEAARAAREAREAADAWRAEEGRREVEERLAAEAPSKEKMTPTLDLEGIDPELLARARARAIREAEEEARVERERLEGEARMAATHLQQKAEQDAWERQRAEQVSADEPPRRSPVDEGEGFEEEEVILDPPAPVEDEGDDFTEEDEERLTELTDNSEEEDITDLFDDEEEEPQAERVPLPERRVSFKGNDYLFYAMSEDGYITMSDNPLEGAVTVKLSQGDIEDELEGVQAKLYQAVQKDEDNFLKALAHRSTAMGFDSPMGCFGSEEERDECAKCFMDIWCKSHETFRAS